jgi:hypothetical protein
MFHLFIYTEEYLMVYSTLSREVLELTAGDGVQEVEHESLQKVAPSCIKSVNQFLFLWPMLDSC